MDLLLIGVSLITSIISIKLLNDAMMRNLPSQQRVTFLTLILSVIVILISLLG